MRITQVSYHRQVNTTDHENIRIWARSDVDLDDDASDVLVTLRRWVDRHCEGACQAGDAIASLEDRRDRLTDQLDILVRNYERAKQSWQRAVEFLRIHGVHAYAEFPTVISATSDDDDTTSDDDTSRSQAIHEEDANDAATNLPF